MHLVRRGAVSDLRSPYTASEWEAIKAALRVERERRQKRELAFPEREQQRVVWETLRPLRENPNPRCEARPAAQAARRTTSG
jgi:hypothetical protein